MIRIRPNSSRSCLVSCSPRSNLIRVMPAERRRPRATTKTTSGRIPRSATRPRQKRAGRSSNLRAPRLTRLRNPIPTTIEAGKLCLRAVQGWGSIKRRKDSGHGWMKDQRLVRWIRTPIGEASVSSFAGRNYPLFEKSRLGPRRIRPRPAICASSIASSLPAYRIVRRFQRPLVLRNTNSGRTVSHSLRFM